MISPCVARDGVPSSQVPVIGKTSIVVSLLTLRLIFDERRGKLRDLLSNAAEGPFPIELGPGGHGAGFHR